jgi:hypothetical protein
LEYNDKVLPIHSPFILWVVSALVSAAKFDSGRIFPARYNYIVCAAELQALLIESHCQMLSQFDKRDNHAPDNPA